VALCYGCHRYLGSNPADHLDFIRQRLGQKKFRLLTKKRNEIVKKSQMLNNHFYNELKLMLENEIT
jgi:hypothetical protein